jgi:pimeloyl-ACP methyl ester carboxylesterase
VNPFFFGSSKSPLYGVYHPPRSSEGSGKAVLLCYPMGAEYMRAHRAFRQLTTLLVKGGAHVLRFDYFGTGDSAGEGTEATVARWLEDIATAIDELQETTQQARVTLVGLRFGATLAALAATERTDVEQVVLWDPIVDGTQYVQELAAVHLGDVRQRGLSPSRDVIGVHGFPVPAAVRTEIEAVDLLTWPGSTARLDVVVSAEREDTTDLTARLLRRGREARQQVFPSNGKWSESDAFGSALIPQGIIQGVLGCVLGNTVGAA